jgi:hypothetical protein
MRDSLVRKGVKKTCPGAGLLVFMAARDSIMEVSEHSHLDFLCPVLLPNF